MALDELAPLATREHISPSAPNEGRWSVDRWRLSSWGRQRRETALLRRREREVARLRAIDDARAALQQASELVRAGWMQGAWFQVRDEAGSRRSIGPLELRLLEGREVIGACLVGAIVEAAGGHRQAHSAQAGRALDLLWDSLQDDRGWPTPPTFDRVCAPAVRAARVRELTSWNDAPERTRGEVLRLIDAADNRAIREATAA